jgi:hypothetical protein
VDNHDTAARHLLDTIDTLVKHGERRSLLLSNEAIGASSAFE